MRLIAIALVAIITISYVNAGIKNDKTFQYCEDTVGYLNCDNATTSQNACENSQNNFDFCLQDPSTSSDCDARLTPSIDAYVSCRKGCLRHVTDQYVKDYFKRDFECLNGSLLLSVSMFLLDIGALLF